MILVTGATGFLGGALVRRLVADGHAVRILRRPASSLCALAGVRFDEVIGDLTDTASVARAVAGCECVFHSAALIQYWDAGNATQDAINVAGTRHVVDACVHHGVRRLVHISSVAAVGYAPDGVPVDETCAYNAQALRLNYADSKYAAEGIVRAGVAQGLDAVMVNPGTIYGPGDRRRAAYVRGLSSWFSAPGGMSVVDVDDVVEGTVRAWQRGRSGERYILTAENLSYREVGRGFAQCLGRRGPQVVVPGWLLRVGAGVASALGRCIGRRPVLTPPMARAARARFYYSNAKACRELGMTFRPFAETAQRTVAWLRAEGLL